MTLFTIFVILITPDNVIVTRRPGAVPQLIELDCLTLLYSAILYSTILCSILLYSTLLYFTLFCPSLITSEVVKEKVITWFGGGGVVCHIPPTQLSPLELNVWLSLAKNDERI